MVIVVRGLHGRVVTGHGAPGHGVGIVLAAQGVAQNKDAGLGRRIARGQMGHRPPVAGRVGDVFQRRIAAAGAVNPSERVPAPVP